MDISGSPWWRLQAARGQGGGEGSKNLKALAETREKPGEKRLAINLSIPKKRGHQVKGLVHVRRRAFAPLP